MFCSQCGNKVTRAQARYLYQKMTGRQGVVTVARPVCGDCKEPVIVPDIEVTQVKCGTCGAASDCERANCGTGK